MTDTNAQAGFASLGIAPKLLAILEKNKFVTPTPIQLQSIPVAITGKDVIGIAQTGTGKTLAFGIPMLQRLAQYKGNGLVVVPTRELALQVEESLHRIGKDVGLKTAVLIGGEPIARQIRVLKTQPHIFIATPGRLNDHLEQGTIKLNAVKIVVLDEADRMLDMGFAPQIKQIFKHVPAERQTLLFSATMPDEIVAMATSYMKLPIRVEVSPAGTTAKNISQEIIFVHQKEKPAMLEQLVKAETNSILVFTRTKYGAKKVARHLNKIGQTAAEIHSNRSLAQRKDALEGFKSGKYRVLVATDIAARGIDVTGISLVINFDLPEHAEDYVHRIGRTARAGRVGKAVSLATPEQKHDVKSIERVIKMVLPITAAPKNLETVTLSAPPRDPNRMPRNTAPRGQRPEGRGPRSENRGPRSEHHRTEQKSRHRDNRRSEPTNHHDDNSKLSPEEQNNKRVMEMLGGGSKRRRPQQTGKIYWHTIPKD